MTIETKYNIGDKVWFMFQGQVQSGYIASITIYRDCVIYNMRANCLSFKELLLFPTKEELIKSVEYEADRQ